MGKPENAPRRKGLAVVAAAFVAFVVAVIVFDLAGVPMQQQPQSGSAGSTYPVNPHRLVSNNLKTLDVLRLNLVTFPQTAVWMLGSSNSGPSFIGPYFVDLGPDWFVLHGPTFPGSSATSELLLPVPPLPGLAGLEFVVQCAVMLPPWPDVVFSNSVTLRASEGPGRHVLVLRQTVSAPGMTNAAQQADSLSAALATAGMEVTIADDVLPPSLLSYDCILDLRFTTTPSSDEPARLLQFLRQCGGVFFVSGPWAGCPEGQARTAWLSSFLASTLGVAVVIAPGGTATNGATEIVDPSADPAFLSAHFLITGLPFDVSDEGGSFGPATPATGMPWLVGATTFPAYGMIFEPSAMTAQTVGGRVAVLFSGSATTFIPTDASPYPELVMCNVAAYLDR